MVFAKEYDVCEFLSNSPHRLQKLPQEVLPPLIGLLSIPEGIRPSSAAVSCGALA